MKGVRSQRGEGFCSLRTFCGQGGIEDILQMRTSALFGAKNFIDFTKFVVYPYGQGWRGIEPVWTFFVQGRGVQFFAILCESLLWAAASQKFSMGLMAGVWERSSQRLLGF